MSARGSLRRLGCVFLLASLSGCSSLVVIRQETQRIVLGHQREQSPEIMGKRPAYQLRLDPQLPATLVVTAAELELCMVTDKEAFREDRIRYFGHPDCESAGREISGILLFASTPLVLISVPLLAYGLHEYDNESYNKRGATGAGASMMGLGLLGVGLGLAGAAIPCGDKRVLKEERSAGPNQVIVTGRSPAECRRRPLSSEDLVLRGPDLELLASTDETGDARVDVAPLLSQEGPLPRALEIVWRDTSTVVPLSAELRRALEEQRRVE